MHSAPKAPPRTVSMSHVCYNFAPKRFCDTRASCARPRQRPAFHSTNRHKRHMYIALTCVQLHNYTLNTPHTQCTRFIDLRFIETHTNTVGLNRAPCSNVGQFVILVNYANTDDKWSMHIYLPHQQWFVVESGICL